jgi:putative RNA 2'-phosphotransferase
MSRDRQRSRSPAHGQRCSSPGGRPDDKARHDRGGSCSSRENSDFRRHYDRRGCDGPSHDGRGTSVRFDHRREAQLLQPMLDHASRWLIKALRHQPHMLNLPGKPLRLEEGGWAPIDHVLQALARNSFPLNRRDLNCIVAGSSKQRFGVSEDGSRIRANQGHSVLVDMKFEPVKPPAVLLHGTAVHFCAAIRASGLSKMGRQHVHLSADAATASNVGSRHGQVVVLNIDAARMHADGALFFCSENGVWLTAHVPSRYISGFP